jgi:hypothetical protein
LSLLKKNYVGLATAMHFHYVSVYGVLCVVYLATSLSPDFRVLGTPGSGVEDVRLSIFLSKSKMTSSGMDEPWLRPQWCCMSTWRAKGSTQSRDSTQRQAKVVPELYLNEVRSYILQLRVQGARLWDVAQQGFTRYLGAQLPSL